MPSLYLTDKRKADIMNRSVIFGKGGRKYVSESRRKIRDNRQGGYHSGNDCMRNCRICFFKVDEWVIHIIRNSSCIPCLDRVFVNSCFLLLLIS